MTQRDSIADVLTSRLHYPATQASIVAEDLLTIDAELTPLLTAWLDDTAQANDYTREGVSLHDLMDEGMTYPAALLTMDWVIKEPDIALPQIRRGIE